jgi:hypothetical protein
MGAGYINWVKNEKLEMGDLTLMPCLCPDPHAPSYDLLPINHTIHFSKKSVTMENDGYENKQIQ